WSGANALAGDVAAGAGEPRSTYGNTMLWAGAHWRPELRLYHMRARQYDPAQGVFLSPDPLGYVDSFDEWLFAGGDPFWGWDPYGLRRVANPEIAHCTFNCPGRTPIERTLVR